VSIMCPYLLYARYTFFCDIFTIPHGPMGIRKFIAYNFSLTIAALLIYFTTKSNKTPWGSIISIMAASLSTLW